MPVRKRVVVAGRVQGVAFRNSTLVTAVQLGVKGWVRNLPNGDVEGCFEGEAEAVQRLVDWCRRGPSAARVDRLIEHEECYSGEFSRFEIRY